jgi:membrane fusion protein, protease secretion system
MDCKLMNDENKMGNDGAVPGGVGGQDAEVRRPARLGMWALAIGFGGFLAWAALAPLDEGVPTDGMVTIDTKRKSVQHLSGGIVSAVLVREGQVVQEGQVLVKLDEATARANYEMVRQRYLGQRAVQGRLVAEQMGLSRIEFHPDLQEAGSDPQIRAQMDNQQMLFNSRRAALAADLQALQEGIAGQRALMQSFDNMLRSRQVQFNLLQEEQRNTAELVRDGYVPRNRQLDLERQMAEIQTAMADLMGNTQRALRSIAELEQRRIARQQQYRQEVETQLSEITREVQSDAERYVAVRADLDRVEIRSPAAGQVVGLAIQTVGGVVQPGQKLMDIVPEGEPLLLETRVFPHLVDKARPGLKTDVRFTAFSHSPQLVVEGEVVSVSGDLLTDPQTGMSYYLARVQISPQGMKDLGDRRMQPGMPAQVIIKTGERSMLTYLLSPLTRRVAASMTEE